LPLDGPGSATSFQIEGAPPPEPGKEPGGAVRAVGGAYFEAMGIPLVAGRGFPSAAPAPGSLVPFVVNKTLARQLFPNGDALGKRLFVEIQTGLKGEIVGIVGDTRLTTLDVAPEPALYWDARSSPTSDLSLVAKTSADPAALTPALVREVRALDPGIAVAVRPMKEILGASLATPRSLALLVAAFSCAALLLTAVGLYGDVSYLVAQRTPEIGVRIALGATPRGVARVVLAGGGRLVGVGVAMGLALAFALAPLGGRLLYGIAPRDPLTFAAVPALLSAVALLACAVPAWRAARVDPVVALRSE